MKNSAFRLSIAALIIISCGAAGHQEVRLPEPLPRNTAGDLIANARRHLGEPYRYGGRSSKGWDCSGFVTYIYFKSTGIALPRSAHDIFLDCARFSYSGGRPGDLIFFKKQNSQRTTHVGIYVGRGEFIHVSTSSGVVISSLYEPYFRNSFIGMGRPRLEKIARR